MTFNRNTEELGLSPSQPIYQTGDWGGCPLQGLGRSRARAEQDPPGAAGSARCGPWAASGITTALGAGAGWLAPSAPDPASDSEAALHQATHQIAAALLKALTVLLILVPKTSLRISKTTAYTPSRERSKC